MIKFVIQKERTDWRRVRPVTGRQVIGTVQVKDETDPISSRDDNNVNSVRSGHLRNIKETGYGNDWGVRGCGQS